MLYIRVAFFSHISVDAVVIFFSTNGAKAIGHSYVKKNEIWELTVGLNSN